jgi:hypothetical protein
LENENDIKFFIPFLRIDMQFIKDGNDDKSFSFDSVKVNKGDTIKVDCLPSGGFAGSLKIHRK